MCFFFSLNEQHVAAVTVPLKVKAFSGYIRGNTPLKVQSANVLHARGKESGKKMVEMLFFSQHHWTLSAESPAHTRLHLKTVNGLEIVEQSQVETTYLGVFLICSAVGVVRGRVTRSGSSFSILASLTEPKAMAGVWLDNLIKMHSKLLLQQQQHCGALLFRLIWESMCDHRLGSQWPVYSWLGCCWGLPGPNLLKTNWSDLISVALQESALFL